MKLKNYFYFALLMLTSVFAMPSCSEDKDLDVDTPTQEEEVANEAGDDFYMFVNGEWHNNLGEAEVSQGFMFDTEASVEKKTNQVLDNMEETKTIRDLYQQLIANDDIKEANIEFADSIIGEYGQRIQEAETMPELGHILGECIANGYIDGLLRLFVTLPKDDNKVCFTLAPDQIFANIMSAAAGEGGEEEEEEGEESRLLNKRFSLGSGERYINKMTRNANNDFWPSVVEGLGLDIEHFVLEDTLASIYEQICFCSVEELKESMMMCLQTELYLYCGDEKAQETTEGIITSTHTYLEKQLPHILAYPLSYHFCDKYVNDEVKAEYAQYSETMREVFAKRIQNNEWLSDETKQQALKKLDGMKFFFGEPEEWNTEFFPELKGNLLAEDILLAKQSRNKLIISMLGKDKREDSMNLLPLCFGGFPLTTYNACHIAETNAMLILPAFMMEPEYTSTMSAAQKFALFYVIGHEMTHGFDIRGSEYDVDGNKNNWWTPADKEKFLALNKALAQQISTFEILPGVMANGNRTVTEDVADLGGLNIAFDALNEHLKDQGITGNELKEAQKAFFERHAFRYSAEYSQPYLQILLDDVHSVSTIRVNGMVQHMNSWYELYNVTESDDMYLPEDKRINIW